ncbi:MAG TPA: hypothetical protein VN657_14075, partial [Nitrospiraceae bacterium]|nr:hypothetical protein [Nitrospiraceae bacterium]
MSGETRERNRAGHLLLLGRRKGLFPWEEPRFASSTNRITALLCRYLTITSTRRFLARPAAVLLLATGLLS